MILFKNHMWYHTFTPTVPVIGKKTGHSEMKLLIMDCTNMYHNADVHNVLTEARIEVFPLVTHIELKDHPPNSHDCMPCELINQVQRDDLEEIQQTAEVTPKHEQSVLRNSRNSRTIPVGLR
jgi:hypothetical protein